MKKLFRVILVLTGIVMFALFMTWLTTRGSRNKDITGEIKPTPSSVKSVAFADKWGVYENTNDKYSLNIPADWVVVEMPKNENFDSRAVFSPGKDGPVIGSIKELSITVVSKPKPGQVLSTSKEFNDWLKKPDMASESSDMQKLNSPEIAGLKAVNLVSSGIDEKGARYWILSTWLRKNGVNYYINTMGKGVFSGDELWIHNKMTSSLTLN